MNSQINPYVVTQSRNLIFALSVQVAGHQTKDGTNDDDEEDARSNDYDTVQHSFPSRNREQNRKVADQITSLLTIEKKKN